MVTDKSLAARKPAKFVVQMCQRAKSSEANASQLNRLGLLNFQRLDDPVSPTAPRAFSRAAKPLYRIDAETSELVFHSSAQVLAREQKFLSS
jgi:hypothetical protein